MKRNFLLPLLFFINQNFADDIVKQCVPCNLPQEMCEVCKGERLYLLTFHNVTANAESKDFDLKLVFSDAPDYPYEAGKGLPGADSMCS